jgi:hypothetical protein
MNNKAKEAAVQLVGEFYSEISGMPVTFILKFVQFPKEDRHFETAKKCAIICVVKMIKEFKLMVPSPYRAHYKDLEKVKTELEKL